MSDHTYKDLFGDGYTTYHEDGSTSHTYKDLFGDGTTTYHSDGSTSHTYKDLFGDGATTYHSDGSSSHTYKDLFGDGTTTYHSDGSTSHTYKDLFGDGYTTYHSGGGAFGSTSGAYQSLLDDSYTGFGTGSGSGSYGSVGAYGGFGGYSENKLSKLSFGGALFTIIGLGAAGYGALRFSAGFSWPAALSLVAVLVLGCIQRNTKREWIRQSVWCRWCHPLMLINVISVVYGMGVRLGIPTNDSSLCMILSLTVPFAYLLLILFLCNYPLGADGDGGTVLDCVILFVGCGFPVLASGGDFGACFAAVDGMFLLIFVRSLLILRKASKECKLSMLAFPLVCLSLYYVADMFTGFAGLPVLYEMLRVLVEQVLAL